MLFLPQPTQKSLFNIGDLSMTGLVGFNHEELNPNACPRARKKDPSQFTSCFACNASTARLGFNP